MPGRSWPGSSSGGSATPLVNPGRYTRKSIFTCCTGIVKAVEHLGYDAEREPDHPPDAILISLPYLLLAEKVTSLAAGSGRCSVPGRRRSAIDDGVAIPNRPMFRSAVHRATAPPADRALEHVAAS